MQIVYISNRSEIFSETLKYVRHFMPFVSDVVVICPSEMKGQFLAVEPTLPVCVIPEEGLLENSLKDTPDHQARNWKLRAALPQCSSVDSEFIMSDDDYRPLFPVSPDVYRSQGKHVGYYYFDDLLSWPNYLSDYDMGQRTTGRLLRCKGFSRLSFSSHMPQIVNKKVLSEAVDAFPEATQLAIDEWSLYFNFALKEFPDGFTRPRKYRTLCWAYPLSSKALSRPRDPLFENFYPHFYATGTGPFSSLSSYFSKATVLEENRRKVAICRKMQIRSDLKRALTRLSMDYSRVVGRLHRRVMLELEDVQIAMKDVPGVLLGWRSSCIPVHLGLVNEGRELELSDLEGGEFELQLGYRISGPDGSAPVSKRGRWEGAVLPATLKKLKEFELDFHFRLPDRPGRYLVQFEMVRSGLGGEIAVQPAEPITLRVF